MSCYYNLRRHETELNIVFAVIIILVLIYLYMETYISGVSAILLFIIFFFTLMISSPKILEILVNNILVNSIIISSLIFIILFWYFKIDILPMGAINDDQMLIFVTLLYVFLTYKIMKSNSSIYKYQRIPQLVIDLENTDNKALFSIRNISDFHAVELLISFEILYPIPVSSISTIRLFIERSYINQIKSFFSKMGKNEYIIHYYIESLESQSTGILDIEEEIQCLIDKEAITKERGLDIIDEELHIIVKYEYKSLNNLDLEKPYYKRFKFMIQPTGNRLVYKSGNPIKLD